MTVRLAQPTKKARQRITTRLVMSMVTDEIIEHDWHWYSGPTERACGASSGQTNLANEQASYYQTLTSQAQQEFGMASEVYKAIQSVYGPIFQKGPNQMGFSTGELNTLNSEAATGTGQAYNAAKQAVSEGEATAGGGNNMLPSGAVMKANQGLAAAGAQQLSGEQNQIEQAGYAQGYSEFEAATNALMGSTSLFSNANAAGGVANQGGAAANQTFNDIAQENASPFNAVVGALGGVAGNVISENPKGIFS